MSYDATPNYEKLKFMLKKCMLRNGVLPGGRFCLENTRRPSSFELDEQTLIIGEDPEVSSVKES